MVEKRVSFRDFVRGFSGPFWAANVSELFERIAFYGMAPVLVPYLTQVPAGLWLHATIYAAKDAKAEV